MAPPRSATTPHPRPIRPELPLLPFTLLANWATSATLWHFVKSLFHLKLTGHCASVPAKGVAPFDIPSRSQSGNLASQWEVNFSGGRPSHLAP
jgi:hypothetical protein